MVVFRKGADPVALDASASRLEAFARECRSVRIASEEVVGRLGDAWAGRDLERLRGDWQRAAPGMDLVEKTLVALGARLRENAARQRGTSGASGDSAISGASGGSAISGASGGSATSAPTKGAPQQRGERWLGHQRAHQGRSSGRPRGHPERGPRGPLGR